MEKLLKQSYANILGIDEHTALVISGKEGLFQVQGLGKLTVINKKGIHEFDNGTNEDLSILQDLLKPDKKKYEKSKRNIKK
jgi:cyanophycinase-like exopeptidase